MEVKKPLSHIFILIYLFTQHSEEADVGVLRYGVCGKVLEGMVFYNTPQSDIDTISANVLDCKDHTKCIG